MRAPKWIRRWLSTRRRWERMVADSERQAVRAIRETRSAREQLAIARQQCDDARARESAVRWAATEEARTISKVRELVNNVEAYTHGRRLEVATSVAMEFVHDLQAALDGGGPNPAPEVDGRPLHQAHLAAMLKEIEWQVNRDYGSEWLAAELFDRGARAPHGHTHPEVDCG